MKVCSKHFKHQDYFLPGQETKARRLKRGALPSQNLLIAGHDKSITPAQQAQLKTRNQRHEQQALLLELKRNRLAALPHLTRMQTWLDIWSPGMKICTRFCVPPPDKSQMPMADVNCTILQASTLAMQQKGNTRQWKQCPPRYRRMEQPHPGRQAPKGYWLTYQSALKATVILVWPWTVLKSTWKEKRSGLSAEWRHTHTTREATL